MAEGDAAPGQKPGGERNLMALPELVLARVRDMAANGEGGSGAFPRRFTPGKLKLTRKGGGPAFSGPGADARDPQPLGSLVGGLVKSQGWKTSLDVGSVMGRWPDIVGAAIAAHSRPERFEAPVLEIAVDSTAWATQLSLMVPELKARLDQELGPGVVEEIRVNGPRGANFRRGPRTVRGGRGPRDTFG